MSPASAALLATAVTVFICAASTAKVYAQTPRMGWLVLTLTLYTVGNLIMLRLIRDVGLGIAFSLSAVIQLVAINVVALVVFGERVTTAQGAGLALAVVAVALITLSPHVSGRY